MASCWHSGARCSLAAASNLPIIASTRAGDDFRYLDWNVYARHGDLLLKRFQEEEDLHVYLFLDCSHSMDFGDPSKFDYARQITAALAYIALADLDRVSIIAYADRIIDLFPLTRGKERILTLLKFLENLTMQGQSTDLARVAGSFIHRSQRSGLAVIVSDLFDQQGFRRGVDMLRHRRYEPHIVQLYDQTEAEPTVLGDVELLDVETRQIEKVTVTERKLRQYKRLFSEFLRSIDTYCRSYGLSCTHSTTQLPFDELILRMMRSSAVVQ